MSGQLRCLGQHFLSLCGGPSLPLAVRNPQKLKSSIFVAALNVAQVLSLNTAHVLRLNKADVMVFSTAHVLRSKTKRCPVITANTKTAAFGCLHKGGRPSAAPLCGFLCVGCEHWTSLNVETQGMCLVGRVKTSSALLKRKACAVLGHVEQLLGSLWVTLVCPLGVSR